MLRLLTGLFFVLTLLSCGPEAPPAALARTVVTAANCTTPQPVLTIQREYVYDLSGYEYATGASPWGLFDENAYVDPKQSGSYNPKTSPHPPRNHALYFKNGGSRIVVDLRIPHKLSEIWLYDRSSATDSIWIYTGTMQQWKLKVAFTAKGSSGQWGWHKLVVEDSTRFVQFRFSSPAANVTEAMLYGCPLSELPAPVQAAAAPQMTSVMMKEFLGVNCFQGTPLKWMKPFYWSRVYTHINKIDIDSVDRYPDMEYYITPNGWWNNGAGDYMQYVDSVTRVLGNKVWYSYMGVPHWMEKKGMGEYDRSVTKIGMNSEDPMSYARHANMLWTMAACYGTTKVDTHEIKSYVPHRFSGKNMMTLYENGNEADADWVGYKYSNPVEYFALSSADYDGHEKRLGPKHGIKQADLGSELLMAGFASLDVNRLRILQFLCNTLRTDSQFLWKGGVQFHHYSYNGTGELPGDRFQSATGGITPEEDSLRQRLSRVRTATHRLVPDVPCILGEYGYDKSRASKTSAPLVPGFSQSESQGIMLLRAINAIAFSGFDRYIIYWIKDNSEENFEGQFLTSGLLREINHENYQPYPAWYYINTLVHHLGNYVPEKIISEQGNVWVYQYRNKLSPDSVAFYVYSPTRKGIKVSDYLLRTGGTAASELSFRDKETTGHLRNVPITNGAVKVEVGEIPTLIFVKER